MRRVENESLLVEALRTRWGDRVVSFVGKGMPVAEQIALFRKAAVVVGPHGAGVLPDLAQLPYASM